MKKGKIILSVVGLLVATASVFAVKGNSTKTQNGTLYTFCSGRSPFEYVKIPCKRGTGFPACPAKYITKYYFSAANQVYITVPNTTRTHAFNN